MNTIVNILGEKIKNMFWISEEKRNFIINVIPKMKIKDLKILILIIDIQEWKFIKMLSKLDSQKKEKFIAEIFKIIDDSNKNYLISWDNQNVQWVNLESCNN